VAFDDSLKVHSILCTRRRITAAAAETTHKRLATRSVNLTIQMALLKAIKLEDKLKHLVELEEVVENEGKYGVISVAESDFVLKLSCIALFCEISIIIRSEVLLCFINARVRKIRNEASSCLRIFSRTLRFYYVASSLGSPLPHLLDGHRKLVGSSAISARSCPGPVRYHWGSIVELEVPPDKTPGLMTLHPHNTNVLQSITYAKSPYPPDRSNPGQKN